MRGAPGQGNAAGRETNHAASNDITRPAYNVDLLDTDDEAKKKKNENKFCNSIDRKFSFFFSLIFCLQRSVEEMSARWLCKAKLIYIKNKIINANSLKK